MCSKGPFRERELAPEWDRCHEEATVTGGSMPALGFQSYTLTECWADSAGLYYQTFRKDELHNADGTVNDNVVCGQESSCPVL